MTLLFFKMLRPEEVEMLVCGSPNLNLADLKKVTTLDGYQSSDQTIKFVVYSLQSRKISL